MAKLSTKCVRYLFFGFTVLLGAVGVVLFSVGLWLVVDTTSLRFSQDDHHYDAGVTSLFQESSLVVCILGVLVFVAAMLGWLAGCRKSRNRVVIFIIVLVLLMVVQFCVVIMAAVHNVKLLWYFDETITTAFQRQYGNDSQTTATVDHVQKELECCGLLKPKDWTTSWWRSNIAAPAQTVPVSCCVMKGDEPFDEDVCYAHATEDRPSNLVHQQGCKELLRDWLTYRSHLLIGIVTGFLFLQIVHVVLAILFHNNM